MDVFMQVNLERAGGPRMLHQGGDIFMTIGAQTSAVDVIVEYGSPLAHVLIGQHSSLTGHLTLEIGMNHDYSRAAAYPFDEFLSSDEISNHASCVNRNQIIIGNDVHIGRDVLIMGGVCIGSGAVICSGSVVAKNVPAYAIVAGNPAQITGYRFDAETIARLMEIRWWNWSEEKIQENLAFLCGDAVEFTARFFLPDTHAGQPDEMMRSLLQLKGEGYRLYVLIADFGSKEEVWRKVVREYLSVYTAEDQTALLIQLPPDGGGEEQGMLRELLSVCGENAPLVATYTSPVGLVSEKLRLADYFITTKQIVSGESADYAAYAGAKIVYGLDAQERIFQVRKEYDVSVGVMTYCPDYDKLFTTLYSIIRQKGCRCEIVIGDDGTPDFQKKKIEDWLMQHGFFDYTIVHNPENKGTVQNVMNAILAMNGRYVKLISPGDYLYDDTVLAGMISFMEKEGYQIAFGRSCYYAKEEERYHIFDRMQPFLLRPYQERDFSAAKQAYLVCQDYASGAAFIGTRSILLVYIPKLLGRVVYAEDSAYVVMVADDIPLGFWDHNFIWYESSGGISNRSSEKWKQRLWKDNLATLSIIGERHEELCELCRWHAEGRIREDAPYAKIIQEYYTEVDQVFDSCTYLQDVDPRELQKLTERDEVP